MQILQKKFMQILQKDQKKFAIFQTLLGHAIPS